jgi:hypothetical protein
VTLESRVNRSGPGGLAKRKRVSEDWQCRKLCVIVH